ncbi:E3 SUMO-protein ligase NSE2 isoform X4 [Arvicanthis niloticus]|uniref:E3 SUMO-protein ligase NSE2 isoform X4 n=1 Tax=Arvicanthis niloticus TaxID=61156 RepID=UPI00402B6EC9
MPGRSSTNSGSTRYISFSGVESALSSLKNFQSCISSGMDTVSSVALDLVETQTEVSSEYSMDKAMVEFAKMDRELNHYVKAVQSTINHVKEERPEKVPDLKLLVEKKFLALQDKNCDADFKENEKFVQFRQQLRELKKQLVKPKEDGRHNEFDLNKDSSRAGNERGTARLVPTARRHFTFPPAVCEGSNCSTSSPARVTACPSYCSIVVGVKCCLIVLPYISLMD